MTVTLGGCVSSNSNSINPTKTGYTFFKWIVIGQPISEISHIRGDYIVIMVIIGTTFVFYIFDLILCLNL